MLLGSRSPTNGLERLNGQIKLRTDVVDMGCGAVDGGHYPGARSGESHHLQRGAAEHTPLRRVLPLHAAGAYQLRRRREAILERETALREHASIAVVLRRERTVRLFWSSAQNQ